jgi:RNA-directed DNA polymerase
MFISFPPDVIQYITDRLQNVSSPESLVALLNDMQQMAFELELVKFPFKDISLKQMLKIINRRDRKYKTFSIPKKSGGSRTITAPSDDLKLIQKWLNVALQGIFTPHSCATGFILGRSVVTNAAMHTGKKYVFNIDLKDFFPSVKESRVRAVLHKTNPFRLHQDGAALIARLRCRRYALPQGAPTSPVLSNAVCMKLDRRLYQLSKKLECTYSRYADDITFSSDKNLFDQRFYLLIEEIITSEGFQIHPGKVRLQCNNVWNGHQIIRQRQEVTGVVVNEKTNVSRHYVRLLRAILHNWKKHGYAFAVTRFMMSYMKEKGFERYNGEIPPLENYVSGKLEYLGMVKGKDDPTYRVMKLAFNNLCALTNPHIEPIQEVFKRWETHGIKKAIDRFYDPRNLKNSGYGLGCYQSLLSATTYESVNYGKGRGYLPKVMWPEIRKNKDASIVQVPYYGTLRDELLYDEKLDALRTVDPLAWIRELILEALSAGRVTEIENEGHPLLAFADRYGHFRIAGLIGTSLREYLFGSPESFDDFVNATGLQISFQLDTLQEMALGEYEEK